MIKMPHPTLLDRLRATLREVDEGLTLRPDYEPAQEFRRFLVDAIDSLEAKQMENAA